MELVDIFLQLAVAAGTFALAYFSYMSIRSSDRQLKFIKKQTEVFLSQQQPDIQIENRYFESNTLFFTLHNSGKGAAKDIAVSCIFGIEKPIRLSTSWLGRRHFVIPKISERGTRKYMIHTDHGPIVLNMKLKDKTTLIPVNGVVFPENEEHQNSLPENVTKTFQCVPLFGLKVEKKRFHLPPDYDGKTVTFEEVKSLLNENNIKEISVFFNLYSKDNLQNVRDHGSILKFVVKIPNDEDLENAFKRGQRGSYPLDKEEIKKELGWLDFDIYIHGKYLEPEEME